MKPTDEMVEAGAKALNTYFCYSALEVDGTCMHSAPIADCHLCRAVIDVDRDKARAVLTAALASQPEAGAGEPPAIGPDTELIYGVPHYGKLAAFAPAPSGKPEAGGTVETSLIDLLDEAITTNDDNFRKWLIARGYAPAPSGEKPLSNPGER